MMAMRLADAADALHARHTGADVSSRGEHDTRTLVAENLFFALKRPALRWPRSSAEAQLRGAAAAIVSRAW